MLTNPMTPDRLLDSLIAIFPEFSGGWEAGEIPRTFHEVMLEFTPFFGANAGSSSPTALSRLGDLINEAVTQDGPFENAVSTCLLEHLHQVDAWRALKPHLSGLARRKSRA